MEYAIALILIIMAVLLWRTNGRDQYHFMGILQSLLAVSVFWMIGQDIGSGNGMKMTGILSGILILHFVISRFWKNKAFYWPPIFILISSVVLFILGDETFRYGSFSVVLAKPEILILPFLGALIEPIANAKEKVLGDFFKIDFKSRRGISRGAFVFVIGLFVFLGHFLGSYVGVSLVMLGFGASLFYNKRSGAVWNMYLGLIAIASIGHYAFVGQLDTINLQLGRVLEGLLFGGGISLFINTIGRARKNQNLATVLSWFLFIAVPVGLILFAKIYASFGGADAFIGLLVGFAFAALLGINTRKNSSLLAVYMASGILLLPLLINSDANEMTTIVVSNDKDKTADTEQKDIFEAAGKTIDLEGSYTVNLANSQLTFELGPKGGRTKGAFRSFIGNFTFGSEGNTFQVKLPVNQLTTFNSYRDESLMEESYFNQEKFPEMTFAVQTMESNSDKYIAKGKFKMLGVEKEKDVEMKYLGKIGKNGAPVFIGRAQIDRTQFGMKSDPKEGDIVDFLFKVELKSN